MAKLGIRLFGAFQAYANDYLLASFRTLKTQALLIYLITEPPGPHRREALMTLLWPDLPPEPAQVNLRQIVYQLRHAIPDADGRHSNEQVPFVVGDRYTIGINPDADFEADVMRRDGCCTRNSACRRRLIPRASRNGLKPIAWRALRPGQPWCAAMSFWMNSAPARSAGSIALCNRESAAR